MKENKTNIKKLGEKLYFSFSAKQSNELVKDFMIFEKKLQFLKKIKVDNVQPTSFITPNSSHNLRDDIPNDSKSNIEKDDYIEVTLK